MRFCTFPGARMLGAPRDWDQQLDGSCGILPILDAVDDQSGFNFMYSFWRPTDEELEALRNGGALRLGIMGVVHPVVNMGIITPEICRDAGLADVAD